MVRLYIRLSAFGYPKSCHIRHSRQMKSWIGLHRLVQKKHLVGFSCENFPNFSFALMEAFRWCRLWLQNVIWRCLTCHIQRRIAWIHASSACSEIQTAFCVHNLWVTPKHPLGTPTYLSFILDFCLSWETQICMVFLIRMSVDGRFLMINSFYSYLFYLIFYLMTIIF